MQTAQHLAVFLFSLLEFLRLKMIQIEIIIYNSDVLSYENISFFFLMLEKKN